MRNRSFHGADVDAGKFVAQDAVHLRQQTDSVTTRPVKGEGPALDLGIAYHKANNSPILKLLLSSVGKLATAP
jgi:hypothetical protein